MKIIRQYRGLFLLIVLFSSCARTFQVLPLADKDETKASILVYRRSLADINSGVKIYCNDTFVGKVGLYRYLKWSVRPGHYVIKAKSVKKASYSLDVEASGTYQLIVEKTVGVPTGVRLRPAQRPVHTESVQPPKIKQSP